MDHGSVDGTAWNGARSRASPGYSVFCRHYFAAAPNNEVYIGAVHEKMDESGKLIHEPTIGFLDIVVNNFITWMNTRK